MRYPSLQATAAGAWQQLGLRLRHLRDWPGDASSPYSPAFSVGLLLIFALAVSIGR
jgi:hypothetical protein